MRMKVMVVGTKWPERQSAQDCSVSDDDDDGHVRCRRSRVESKTASLR